MSRNGQLCLQKIIVSYSPSGGDPAMRQFMAVYLPLFHRTYPSVTFDVRPRMWPEQSITGVYRDGSERAYSIRNLSAMGIHVRCHRLVNEANDVSMPFSHAHVHYQRKSVQGPWNAWLWNYETSRSRGVAASGNSNNSSRRRATAPPPHWARKLNDKEWGYYVAQYGAQLKAEEEAIAQRVERHTELPEQSTREVQQRWQQHVVPRLQSDLEHNLDYWKRQHRQQATGGSATARTPRPPSMHEYSLFAVPDHSLFGQDAVNMLRVREAKAAEAWWRQRKDQLKPPL